MRRTFTSAAFRIAALTSILTLLAVLPAAGQDTSATTSAPPDTARAGKDKPGGRLRISIDESGISVEGEARVRADAGAQTDDGEEWVEIIDDRGPLREKGVDIVKFGKSVFVANDEMVRGDLVVFGGNAIVEGRVTGNVFVIGGNIRLRSGAEIKGDAMVIGGVIDDDDDAIIHGERILFDDIVPDLTFGSWFAGTPLRWVMLPVMLFIVLVLAFLVLLFLRDRMTVGDEHLSSNFLKSFGAGILTSVVGLFALLIVMIPLVITVIGIPLALLLVVSCCGVFIIAWTLFAFTLGRLVSERLGFQSNNAFLFVFVGAVVLFLPEIISFGIGIPRSAPLSTLSLAFKGLSMLLGFFAHMSGLGALVLSRFGSRPLEAVPPSAAAAPSQPTPTA